MPTPIEHQLYERAFTSRVRTSSPRYGKPDGAFTEALGFATVTRHIPEGRTADVVKALRLLSILMHIVHAAQIAAAHEHSDRQAPVFSSEECEKHRAAYAGIRTDIIGELQRLGVNIDLQGYERFKAEEFLEADAPDPCRVLEDVIVSVRRGLGYRV